MRDSLTSYCFVIITYVKALLPALQCGYNVFYVLVVRPVFFVSHLYLLSFTWDRYIVILFKVLYLTGFHYILRESKKGTFDMRMLFLVIYISA